jgi:non-homologous end joining protein Ku
MNYSNSISTSNYINYSNSTSTSDYINYITNYNECTNIDDSYYNVYYYMKPKKSINDLFDDLIESI